MEGVSVYQDSRMLWGVENMDGLSLPEVDLHEGLRSFWREDIDPCREGVVCLHFLRPTGRRGTGTWACRWPRRPGEEFDPEQVSASACVSVFLSVKWG